MSTREQTQKTQSRAIIRLAVMVLLALFLFVSINLLFMPKYIEENKDGRITAEFYREKIPNDVLFIGSSTVYSAINPIVLFEEYGMTSFDRANSSQTAWVSYYMVKDAIEYAKPKMVVMDLSFLRYGDDYVEEAGNRKAIDGMRPSKTKYQCIKAAKSPDESYKDYLLPIGRFHTRWKHLTAEDWKYLYYKPTVSYNGYLPDYAVEAATGEPNTSGIEEIKMSARNELFLKNILTICRDNEIELLLIKVPTYSPKWGEEFTREIRLFSGGTGVDYIDFDDYTEEIGIDYTKDTADGGGHLNDAGAAKFSKYLGQYLTEHYQIADHRMEPDALAVWLKKCERYHNGQ